MARRMAVVGAGLIGRAWAMVFARAGWDVALYDPVPAALDAAPALCAEGLADQHRQGLCNDPAGAAARIRVEPDLARALQGAELVQENGPERLDDKRAIFAELDRLAAPGCILASSTSGIPCSSFNRCAADMNHPSGEVGSVENKHVPVGCAHSEQGRDADPASMTKGVWTGDT